MNFYKRWCCCILLVAISMTQMIFAEGSHAKGLNDKDEKALREFLATKRSEDILSKGSDIVLSGDVRTEYRHLREKIGDRQVFGRHGVDCDGVPLSGNDIDIEMNLWLNIEQGRAWAVANVQYDNGSGVDNNIRCDCDGLSEGDCRNYLYRFHGSGRCNNICLKRAYLGYTLWEDCGQSVDIEVGRRRLYDFLESDLQFMSRFDGVSLKYTGNWESASDWYVKWCGLVVDEKVNQFAWGAELAAFNVWDSGFDLKYTYMDWQYHGRSRCDYLKNVEDLTFNKFHKAFNYNISQVLVNYTIDKDVFCVPALVYGAALYNTAAKRASQPATGSRQGFGWYAGVLLGEVEKQGDWSLELEYQYLQRNAVPYDDQSGIGLGNFLEGCCDSSLVGVGYQGWMVEFLYAITDNLTIDTILEAARSNEKRGKNPSDDGHCRGLRHTYSKLEVELIYAY